MSKTPIFGVGTDFTISSNGYIASFITDVGDPNLLEIPAGNWNFEMYFSASSNGGAPNFAIDLYKYDGALLSLIASNSATPENITNGTSIDLYFTSVAVPLTTLTITDRLAIRILVKPSGKTIKLHTEDSHLGQIITTFTTGLTALNGLTNQVQYLATGVSGSDFNISSVGDTHTFNLPDASALNTGKLTSTDWAIFNGKGTITSVTATAPISSSGGTTPVISTNVTTNNILIGRATAGPGVMEEITLGTNLSFTGLTLNAAGGGGIAITSVTYSTLQGLMSTSTLVQGSYYLINDFRTIYDQPDYTAPLTPSGSPTTLTAATEPLIVQAATTSTLNSRAISTIYPKDVIEYDPYFTATEITGNAAKGRITYRIDTQNNKTNYDSRGVLFKRYETTAGSGIFSIYWDNGETATNLSTFDGDSYNNTLGNFYTPSAVSPVSPFILSNNVFLAQSYDNQTGNDFFNNTFVGICYANVFGNENTFNLVNGSSNNNRIGDSFKENTIDSDFISNQIGTNFFNNIIGKFFLGNQIAADFQNNINILDNFKNNIFEIGTNGLDYIAATHVYQNYNCTVFLNAAPTESLSYYDATNTLTITAPNS